MRSPRWSLAQLLLASGPAVGEDEVRAASEQLLGALP